MGWAWGASVLRHEGLTEGLLDGEGMGKREVKGKGTAVLALGGAWVH
jgi:hypothetical protein